MENLIGWLLIAAFVVVPAYFVIRLIRRHRAQVQQNRDQLAQYQSELDAARARERERWRQNAVKPSTTDITRYPKVVGVSGGGGGGRSYTSSATALPATTSTASNDNALQDLAMLYVLNTALEHGSARAHVDYDAGSIKVDVPSSSDDEDRRVVSDTFSSSDSSSSWSSSDSSSSSDVSSDW